MRSIDEALIVTLADQAAASRRRRQHYNLHADYADPCQRLLNFIWHDSYICPHRHAADPKEETLIALRGEMSCIPGLMRTAVSSTKHGCPRDSIAPRS